jgi:hypothetical protein
LTPEPLSRLRTGSVVAVLICAAPIFFYSYMCFPTTSVWETPFFVFTSKYYENVETFMWVFLQKFVFFYLLVIWFFTSKDWWHKAILVPIGMMVYQIINLLNDDLKFKDEALDAIVVLPLVAFVCFLLWQIRKKMSFTLEALNLKELIDLEIKKATVELQNKPNND